LVSDSAASAAASSIIAYSSSSDLLSLLTSASINGFGADLIGLTYLGVDSSKSETSFIDFL
jgi:hypothetical protein